MSRLKAVITVEPGTPAVPYGPAGDVLPARFSAEYTYADLPFRLNLDVTFDGVHRAHVERLCVSRDDGVSLAPEDMSALKLASVMSTVVFAATRHGPGVVDSIGERSGPPTDEDLRLLARMYWFHWVSWGNPRQMIMSSFGLPRSTANDWIRKARERYPLPGLHAKDGES